MRQRRWPARAVIRYTLLQVPATVLLVVLLIMVKRWVALPGWFIWTLVGLWVLKDIVLFPLVWRAYDPDRPSQAQSMEGMRGVAVEPLEPYGYVRVRGELWKAELASGSPPMEAGAGVRVCGIRGLTLLVQPEDESERKS